MEFSGHRRERPRSFPSLGAEKWDRSRSLRGWLAFAFTILGLGAAGNWYNWSRGAGSFSLSVGLTAGALVVLLLSPKRWDLLAISAAGTLGLEILALLLRKGPARPVLEAMAITVGLLIVCEYVKLRVRDPRAETDKPRAETKAG